MRRFSSSREILNIAHRGGAGERPENTLEAFRHALAVGADVLELDVRLSREGVLVVSHDPDLERITGTPGRVAEFTVPEIREYDAGARWSPDGLTTPYAGIGLTLPTLEEVFQELPGVQMNVDIKVEEPEAAHRLAELIRRYDRAERTVVASFSPRQLNRFRRLAPEITTSAHPRNVRRFYAMSRLGVTFLAGSRVPYLQVPEEHGNLRLVTPGFVEAAHRAGREIHVWTVNDRTSMERLAKLQVDGIVTDLPSTLTTFLDESRKGRAR